MHPCSHLSQPRNRLPRSKREKRFPIKNKYYDALTIAAEIYSTIGFQLNDIEVDFELSGGVCDCSGNSPAIITENFSADYSLEEYNHKYNITEIFSLYSLTPEALDDLADKYVNIVMEAVEKGKNEWEALKEDCK